MEYKNSKRAIYTPIIGGLILIVGIIIGHTISGKSTNFYLQQDKIGQMLELINEKYVDTINVTIVIT